MIGRAAVVGGVLGLLAGVAARLSMRLLFLLNPETEGLVVAELFPVGGFTTRGTVLILGQGVALGAVAGVVYALVRASLPTRGWIRGLTFGAWLVSACLGFLVLGEDRDFQVFGPFGLAVGLFASIFLAFETALGYVANRPGIAVSPVTVRRSMAIVTLLSVIALIGLAVLVQSSSTESEFASGPEALRRL